jgi:hypothetical protein
MFDPLTRGKIGGLFGTTTNLTPDDIFGGKSSPIFLWPNNERPASMRR